jgi:hypothetical protein
MINSWLTYIVGAGICLFGSVAIYFFVAMQLISRNLPDAGEAVLALAILSIGASVVIQTRLKTKSTFWFAFANLSFWFFLYAAVFCVKQVMHGVSTSWHELVFASVTLALTVMFSRRAYNFRKRKGADV